MSTLNRYAYYIIIKAGILIKSNFWYFKTQLRGLVSGKNVLWDTGFINDIFTLHFSQFIFVTNVIVVQHILWS